HRISITSPYGNSLTAATYAGKPKSRLRSSRSIFLRSKAACMPPRLRICGLCCFLPWLKQGAVLVAFRPVAIKDGTGEKHERYRRGDGDEDADEDLVENRATLKPGKEDHRRHDDRAGAPACSERRRMDTVIETA